MPQNRNEIGSHGLEQGGPNLGNEYTRDLADQGQEQLTVTAEKRNQTGQDQGRNSGSDNSKGISPREENERTVENESDTEDAAERWEESSLLEDVDELEEEDLSDEDDEDDFEELSIDDEEDEEEKNDKKSV